MNQLTRTAAAAGDVSYILSMAPGSTAANDQQLDGDVTAATASDKLR
jgi:hypothetical protein